MEGRVLVIKAVHREVIDVVELQLGEGVVSADEKNPSSSLRWLVPRGLPGELEQERRKSFGRSRHRPAKGES